MIGDIRKFRFWCQKVLPLVYDDSLSYYEILCKVVQYLNNVIEDVNSIPDYIDGVIDEKLSDEHLQELIEQFMLNIEASISSNNEGDNTNSSADYNIGQMLWWNGKLYRVIRTIDAGDTLIDGTNVEIVNFEDLFNSFIDEVKHDITANDDGTSATATQNWSTGTWVWLNDVLYKVINHITEGNAYVFTGESANVEQITVEIEFHREETTRANADTDLQTAIDNEATAREDADEAEATARENADEAEATAREGADEALQTQIGDLDDLTTTTKDNLVGAINEVDALGKSIKYYVTPEDYGALGGNNDDTIAVQAAINDGRPVFFTQNYRVSHLDIPYDVSRAFFLDGQDFWLTYIGSDETSMIKFTGVTATIKNFNIINPTSQSLIGIEWTSEEVGKPSEFNTFENIKIYNFNTAIYFGDLNGVLDTSQSENSIIGLITRGCNLVIYSTMDNGTLNVSNSQLICSEAESSYTFDTSRAGIIWCYGGVVHVVNSSLVMPTIQTGCGMIGKNIVLDDCIIELASRWALCTGDISINNNNGGYYSNVNVSPFAVDPNATGMLRLNGFKIRFASYSTVKLIAALTTSGNDFSVAMSGCVVANHANNSASPISDYYITINGCLFNSVPLASPSSFDYTSLNSSDFSYAGCAISSDTGGNVVVTASVANAYITTPVFDVGVFASIETLIREITGSWDYLVNYTNYDGTTGTLVGTIHTGIVNHSFMYGAEGIKSFSVSLRNVAGSGNIKFKYIHINAMKQHITA